MHVCQRWYSCRKHRLNMLAASPVRLLLWQSWSFRLNEIYPHVGVPSLVEWNKNHMVRDQVSTEGVAKWWPVSLQVPLGQGQNDVQGRCHVATTNSSLTEVHDAYNNLNHVNDQEFPCSGFCLQLHLLGWIPCEQFHLNKKSVQASPCLLTCLVSVFSVMTILAFSRWRIVANHTGNTMFCLQLRNVGSSSAVLIGSPQIVMRSSRWSCVRMLGTLFWVTHDMFRSSVRIL